MNKIIIHNTTYIFLLLSFFAVYFEYIYLLLLIIIIHEIGHATFAKIINFKFDKIIIYPFGGITKYNEDLNISSNKELMLYLGFADGLLLEFILSFLTFEIRFLKSSLNTM